MQQTRMVTEAKNPVERALDLFVFAPLGLAMTARSQMPDMVASGRAQVEGQLMLARFIGQFAVKQGKAEVSKRLKGYGAHSGGHESGSAPVEPEPVANSTISESMPSQPAPAEPESASGPEPSVAALAIPGYDALSASQVVQRLAGLSSAELEQVRFYEATTRGRKTVLTKISQLQ